MDAQRHGFDQPRIRRVCLTLPPLQRLINAYRVAVYAYGLWDDNTNPIYTITVDDDTPVELGSQTNPNPQSCDPLYSKSGLSLKSHEITLQMTSIRPDDVRDLSFQGFM
jgi:hypothetical protein